MSVSSVKFAGVHANSFYSSYLFKLFEVVADFFDPVSYK